MANNFDIRKIKFNDPNLNNFTDPNLYCIDAAYNEEKDRPQCCFIGCITKLSRHNKRDFCFVHIEKVMQILSCLPEEGKEWEWKYYSWLEVRRGRKYGLEKRVV